MGRIYYQFIDVTDYGPFITKLILGLPAPVSAAALKAAGKPAELFNVHVRVLDKKGDVVQMPKSFLERDVLWPSEGYRIVKDAYPSTRTGETLEESEYLTLELVYGPIYKCTSAIASDPKNINGHGSYTVHDYTVTQLVPIETPEGTALNGLVFDRCAGVFNPKESRFKQGAAKNGMRYGYYVPSLKGSESGRHPLIIFLHGAGEGGFDTAVPYTGNKVTCFTEPDTQALFGGAFVLAPQCETMWLDDGSHQYGSSGKSMYVKDLKECIDEFIADYADAIDTDRILLGGDSNGGFMTMRMLMDYPDFFAAAFPICEAMLDERISEEDIAHLKEIPIWFTHAKNDPVVVPDKYVVPTYKRLIAAGAKNCHFTFWDKIVDIHAGWDTPDGKPFEYFGHFAWIPMFNNDCKVDFDGSPVMTDGKAVSIFEWLSGASRKH